MNLADQHHDFCPFCRYSNAVERAKVLCFGEALWDITPAGRMPGGAPMNAALRLAGCGVETGLLSRVGDDEPGRELADYMAGQGLGIGHLQFDAHRPTGRVNVDTSDPQAVRYEIVSPAAWDYIDADAFFASAGDWRDVIVFGSLAARNDVSRRTLLRLLEHARLRVFDVNLRPPFDSRDVVELLLDRSDWIKLNDSELGVIAEWLDVSGTPEYVLRTISDHYAIDVVCLTLGSGGAMMVRGDSVLMQPGFTVPVVDSIGCGDAFLGAWVAGMLAGDEPAAALRHACATGAVVASQAGANPPVTEEKIQAIIDGA